MMVEFVVQSGIIVALAKSSAFVGVISSASDGLTRIVCQAQSSSLFGVHFAAVHPLAVNEHPMVRRIGKTVERQNVAD